MKNKKRHSKNKFLLKECYKKSWTYIKESKNFIYFAIGIFLIFVLIGFFVSPSQEISDIILNYIQEILAQTEGLSAFGLIRFIFLNNLQSSFSGMIFGFLFGIFPFIAALFNGYVIGFVSELSVESAGFSSLLNLLPHGIFELPAIFISLGLGLKFGTFWFKKNRFECFKKYLLESLRVFVFIVIPLLIIAAVIEGLLIVFV